MDMFQCTKNISCFMNLYNLTLCSSEKSICVEGQGYCVFNEKSKPWCHCLPCFTGKYCEEEKVSKNLWFANIPLDEAVPSGTLIQAIIVIVFGAFLLFNGVLCLQTYLCKKIRKTNLGIYLIMLSIVSIFIGLIHLIFNSIGLHVKELSQPYIFLDLQCLIYGKFVYIPLVSMYNLFITSVAIERMLVECFGNYGLHDSRRRSVISSVIIVIICPLTTLPGVFTVRKTQLSELRSVQCVNFTPLGYILYAPIAYIYLFTFYFMYIVMNTVVLAHLLRHRRRFVDSDSLSAQVRLVLYKHKDFFIPYLIQALGQLPSTLMDFSMTCSTANTILAARVSLVFNALEILPFVITFYLYIYLSPVYWAEFWNSSSIGKCLIKATKKLQNGYHSSIINNNNLLETHV